MKRSMLIFLIPVSLAVTTAHAWNVQEDHGDWALIRCGDGSSAKVAKLNDGNWTSTEAGRNGKTGGSFPILGQAALYACGE